MCNAAAVGVVAPVWLLYRALAAVVGAEQAFPGASQLFSLLPGVAGQYLRRAFYRLALPHCGRDVCIAFQTVMSHPTAELGNHVYLGIGCMVGDATLGDDVLVGSHVSIINGARQHGTAQLDVPVRLQPGEYPRITIGADAWLGDRSVVMASVGAHAIVGAGSVVTRPVPDYAIVAGNPARIIRWRRQPDNSNPADAAESLAMAEAAVQQLSLP